MSEELEEKVMLTAEVPRELMERLKAETRRQASRLQLPPNRARSVVVRLAIVAYLERQTAELPERAA